MKNREYIMLLISLFVTSILIFGIIYANIKIEKIEERLTHQNTINEYLLNNYEVYHA